MNNIRKNNNWRFIHIKDALYLINIVNSKQLHLESSVEHTDFLFSLFDKFTNREVVKQSFYKKYPTFDYKWVDEYINQLVELGVLEFNHKIPSDLTGSYLLGLDRQLDFLKEIEGKNNPYNAQLRLKKSKIAILGLGSVAHYTIMALVASGIGSYKCVDFDIIEERNIGRQPIFKKADIGKLKSEVVGEYIHNSRADVQVEVFNKKLQSEKDVEEIIFDADIVIHLCDLPRFVIHRWINSACLRFNKPNILCYSGRVGPFCVPFKTACYGCLESAMEKKFLIYDALVDNITNGQFARFPELAVVGSTAGILVAKEIIAYLLNIRPETYNAFMDINPFTLKTTVYRLPKNRDCYACSNVNPKQKTI